MKTSDQQLGVSPGLIRRTNATPVGHVAVPASGPRYWKSVWSSRHTVAAVVAFLVLALVLFSVRSTALAGQLPSAFDLLLLAPAAALGAVTLATYVPPAGVAAREHLAGGSCAIVPIALVVGSPLLVAQSAGTTYPLVLLLVFLVAAAAKRITDHASC
ncbi:hypothetical protein [Aestuariimicrobium kwangyangense]|uniref:hypothetical protein n=1 Tax=Aestuariimicrobium kwangyangense TaxID=396389 RepID=UPI0003B5558D|nr:hypothetical protein [Aestuariimicrobium kwangyangense]